MNTPPPPTPEQLVAGLKSQIAALKAALDKALAENVEMRIMDDTCHVCGKSLGENDQTEARQMSIENTTDEAASPPVPCAACAAAIEASELRWVRCGGLSVGTYRQPMVWRLRDKYSSDVICQNAKYSQRLAAAARLVHALKEHVTEPEMLERMEQFLKPNA